jgi:hypothetical protein
VPPSTFHCQNNYSHNFNKQKQEGEELPSTPHLETKKKLESFYKVQKVVCASQFLLDFHQVGLVWININSCNPHVVECHTMNKWGNPCPWLLNFQTKFTKVGIFVVWKVHSHFVLFGDYTSFPKGNVWLGQLFNKVYNSCLD